MVRGDRGLCDCATNGLCDQGLHDRIVLQGFVTRNETGMKNAL